MYLLSEIDPTHHIINKEWRKYNLKISRTLADESKIKYIHCITVFVLFFNVTYVSYETYATLNNKPNIYRITL